MLLTSIAAATLYCTTVLLHLLVEARTYPWFKRSVGWGWRGAVDTTEYITLPSTIHLQGETQPTL